MEIIDYFKENALLLVFLLVFVLLFSYISLKRNRKKLDNIKKNSIFYDKSKRTRK